jgi:hypothetical protein
MTALDEGVKADSTSEPSRSTWSSAFDGFTQVSQRGTSEGDVLDAEELHKRISRWARER